MLKLTNITKSYSSGDTRVEALRGIDIEFRKNEFVSILGPSGCGKTTLLNIIGGLDRYDAGDLTINGKSTKQFKDSDWDSYRNHSIGFVFQSYNLIPHQTVLSNVELALTLSGVSRAERRRRAVEVLERVGLGDQLHKKPNQMSGGQMQRVAIARALVNDPDILLADEPTGALDSETSVQIMELLREVAKDRLVIMVTHNPELAAEYSTRIVRLLDGRITDDTDPYNAGDNAASVPMKTKRTSMSFFTAFLLSLQNLLTKKGRTALTSFAGSIGIIGIALIFSVSQGMTTYIDTVQEDTLSSYPLTLQAQHLDVSSLMLSFMGQAESMEEHENDAVYQKEMIYALVNALSEMEVAENDLASFKTYIEDRWADEDDVLHDAVSGIQYTYDMDMVVYTENVDGKIIPSDSVALMRELMMEHMGMDMQAMSGGSGMGSASMMSMSPMAGSARLWQEMLPGENGRLVSELLEKQYDVVYGSWPTEYDEIVLVLDENNELDDMVLYALGLTTRESMDALMEAAMNGTGLEAEMQSWSYEEICDMEFRVVLGADCYSYDELTGTYTDLRETDSGLKYLYDNGTVLKVSGIIRPNPDAVSTVLTGSIGYTSELTRYIIEKNGESAAVQAQLEDPSTDIFNGLPFREITGSMTDEEKEEEFRAYVEDMETPAKAMAYVQIMSIPSAEELDAMVSQAKAGMDRTAMEETMVQVLVAQMGMAEDDIRSYTSAMEDEEIDELFTQMVTEQMKAQYAAQVQAQLAGMEAAQLAAALDMALPEYTTEQCAVYHDEVLVFSDSTYDANLRTLSYVDEDVPSSINMYASSFENKDVIEEAIAEYNAGVDDLEQIEYTDYVGLMMSSVTTIINAITYVLVAFVAVSLVVSSIMIGVITLISVQERTKEIGILRAIGASKRNVSSMFNAETMIIGFTSGALGVLVTWLLCFPINAILHSVTGIQNLNAYLPWQVGATLVVISVLLTLIAGIIPSRSAAKKDPVVALRTE